MVSDELLDRDELGFGEWAITPDPDVLIPESVEREQTSKAFREEVGDGGAIVLTHTDADGLTSGALVRFKEGLDTTVQPIGYYGAYQFEDALQDLNDLGVSDRRIYILDFNPDGREAAELMKQLSARANLFEWYDHHQWEDDILSAYEATGADITIDEDECTASLLGRELDVEWPDHIEDLIAVTKDRDLWIRDDPRSEDLSTYAMMADPSPYISTVTEYGPDLPDGLLNRIHEEQERNAELEEFAVENATFHEIEGYDVAYTYRSGGVSSNIGNSLVEDTEADIALVANPHGGVSVYSHSDRETFARCHEIAEVAGGGGHPTAAGFGLDFANFREQAEYWASAGGSARLDVLIGVDEVICDE